jgi:ferritin-like metal-binding protein YciE
MPIASLKELYFDELGDLYDAETQMLRTLPRLVEAARAPDLREALKRHYDESRLHLERLELIFTHWGERRRARPCAGIAGIVQEADERLNDVATDDVRDAAIIGMAQRIEHYEIAAYGCARTYARRLNRLDEARLLQETLDDEGRTDHRLTELAEARINDDARAETDFQAPHQRKLTYVSLEDVARQRGSSEPIPIRTSANEDLGRLDGLVVDTDRGRVRYIVADAGGIMHRRSLLPIGLLRFDARTGVLLARTDRNVAQRYPPFDPDEFTTMTEPERARYETHVLDFFAPDRAPQGLEAEAIGELPEWLLKGTWITVPPQCADKLPASAREFVNEFAPVPAEDLPPPPGCEPEHVVARDHGAQTRRRDDANDDAQAAPQPEKLR